MMQIEIFASCLLPFLVLGRLILQQLFLQTQYERRLVLLSVLHRYPVGLVLFITSLLWQISWKDPRVKLDLEGNSLHNCIYNLQRVSFDEKGTFYA